MEMRMTLTVSGLVLALLVALPIGRADTNALEVEEDNSLASTLITPHKAWGRGYVGGRVRALFFIYTGAYDGTWEDTGTRVREAVELGQRFDLNSDAILFCGQGTNWVFHGQKLGEDRAERLLEQPYDLYVIAGFALERLPAKMQYQILSQVAKGAGIVCCGPGATDFMVPRRLVDPTPDFLTRGLPTVAGRKLGELAAAYRLGRGRGVWLKYAAHALTPANTFTWRGLAEYDYWMMLVGRAALWAAGRESQIALDVTPTTPDAAVARGEAHPAASAVITSAAQQASEVTVELELRRAADGLTTPLGAPRVVLPPGQTVTVPVALPRVRAGDYYVDVVVRSERGVEAFGAAALQVTTDYGVEAVTVQKTFAERGETVTGAVSLRGTPPPAAMLRIAFRDSYDRVLRQQDVPVTGDRTDYSFAYVTDAFSTILMRVQACLMVGDEEVEMKEASFTVPRRRHGQMNFVMWDAPEDVLGYYACRKMQEAGIGVYLLGSFTRREQPPAVRACDGSVVPYSTRILDPKDENGYMQPVCWNDDPAAQEYVEGIVANQIHMREHGVFVYSLGDEGVTAGCCVHPSCLAAYRRYLADQYATIENLNESWGTQYRSFDEVDLLNRRDNMEQEAMKTSPARWYDRQAFARHNLMQFSRRFVEAYRRLDPEAITGFEGTGGFGDDYDLILGINGFYGPYPSIGDDIIRSVARRDLVRSNWMGYSKTGDALSDAAWRMVMKGMDSIWYWMWSGIGSFRGYLRPTLDFWPMIEDLKEEMRPVRQGLGDLLLKSEVVHSGIAVFYSLPSALSGQLETSPQFISPQQSHETWTRLTYDLGLDFRYLTSKVLTSGALDTGEFTVLLLPMTQAIAPDEAAAIRRFVDSGGTVIADVRPGIFDGHCKPVAPGMLDELFGVERTGRVGPVEARLVLDGVLEGQALRADLGKVRLDPAVRAAGATELGTIEVAGQEVPVLLSRRTGSGRAILLNLQFTTADPREPATAGAWDLLRALYGLAGVGGPLTASAPDGGPLPQTETRVWRNGEGLIFGLWRRMENEWFSPRTGTVGGQAVPAQVTLPRARHVYDLREHRYLGRVESVQTRLRWGRASFFLALPYPIGPLSVAVDSTQPDPGSFLTASIRLGVPEGCQELFAVWVEVFDPAGQEQLWGRHVVLMRDGEGSVQIARAFNDSPGPWRVRVTELFSNQTAEATWTVR